MRLWAECTDIPQATSTRLPSRLESHNPEYTYHIRSKRWKYYLFILIANEAMPHHLQRAMRAHATRPVTFFPCPSLDNRIIRWRPHKWPAKGIEPGDPERTIASSVNTSRLIPAQAAAQNRRAQDLARYASTYQNFRPRNLKHEMIVRNWEAAGPPPISEYKLTFGKHRGKRLDEVPDSYLVKYLIPRSKESGYHTMECPLVGEAIGDFLKKYPDIKGQAGRGKTQPLKNRDVVQQKPTRKGRKKAAGEGESGGSLSKNS
jgi:hypothetical protein